MNKHEVVDRILSVVVIVVGGYFLAKGTQWEIGLGASLLTWAGLPYKGEK